jgi:hypothetical protein
MLISVSSLVSNADDLLALKVDEVAEYSSLPQ